MIKKVIILLVIFIFYNNIALAENKLKNIFSKNDFEIIANVNNIAITKYDLNNFIFITNYSENKKISNKIYNESLENYIDVLKKRIIAEKNRIELIKEEKDNLWYIFSKNLNTSLTIDEFCEKNNLDKQFVLYFFESNYLWYKYVETVLKQGIEIDDTTVNNVLEFIAKKQFIIRYNLSEIVLYFENKEQKTKVLNRLNNIYNSLNLKNFGLTALSVSQSSSAKNNGNLGWLFENELNSNIIKSLGNSEKNSIIKPFCFGEDTGACFIFKINDREKRINISENEKNNVVNYIFSKILGEKIKNIIFSTKIDVIYK